MVKQIGKVLEVTRSEAVPKVTRDTPRVASETLVPNLFDIDPSTEPERPTPVRIDLKLDQLEDAEE